MRKDHRSYDVPETELTIQRVQREIQRYEARYHIDLSGLRSSVEAKIFYDEAAQKMVLGLMAKVASKKYDVKTVRFPSGPWQWVKFNYCQSTRFGRWLTKRWPIRYTEVTLEATAYHPDIAIPDHATYVDIVMRAKHGHYL